MISQAALARTALVAPGSRVSERLLVKLPEKAAGGLTADAEAAALRGQLESALPDAQVMDFREGNPALSRGLDNATAILSLICLVAMVLGAIGVAMAMHAHLEQRMDMLAILKAVGAGSGDLLRIFLLQTLGLGLAGGVLGVAAGVGVMVALPSAFGNLLPVHVVLNFPWQSALAGLGTGLLTTLLFCLPPLLDVRTVRPVLVLRQAGGVRPGGIQRLVLEVVGAAAATGHCGFGGGGAGRNCVGAVRLGQGGRLVCGDVYDCAGGSAGAGGSGVMDGAFCSGSRAAAAAFVSSPWAGESLPARKPIGGSAGGARHGGDADPGGLPDAGAGSARA